MTCLRKNPCHSSSSTQRRDSNLQRKIVHKFSWQDTGSSQKMNHILACVAIATTLLHSSVVAMDTPKEFRHHSNEGFRLCVADTQIPLCREMSHIAEDILKARHDGPHDLQCISAPDKISCIDRIIKGDADFTILDPEELYIAYRFLPDNGIIVTSEIRSLEYSTRNHRYAPAVVVRANTINSISDLRGKRSCHTGYQKTSGFKVPFSHLFINGQLTCNNDTSSATENDIKTLGSYFSSSCLPGQWGPDPATDKVLKAQYPQLCSLCKNPETCSMDDPYAGYQGALTCLTQNNGDIAWTKLDAIQTYFKSMPEQSTQFELLCRDGSKMPLSSENPCTWAQRPWKAIALTNHYATDTNLIQTLQELLTQLQTKGQASSSEYLTNVLEFNQTTDTIFHYPPTQVKTLTPQTYLQPTNFSETIWHPSCGIYEKSLRICVFNQVELQKCNALKLAAIGERISPGFSCILSTCPGRCSRLVARGEADLVLAPASSGDKILQNTGRLPTKLTPILTEVLPTNQDGITTPYLYALAVIPSDIASQFQGNLSPLKGKRSCHGSIKSIAGWNVPLTVLRDAGEISGENCELSVKLSQYFSKSCVPGALQAQKKDKSLPAEQLCSLCAGDAKSPKEEPFNKETLCADLSTHERYQGSKGALKCLEDGTADVAFIDHVTLLEKLRTTGTKDAVADVQLLCKNGTVANAENFMECHWGTVTPSRFFVRGGDEDKVLRENARLSLLRANELFGRGGKLQKVFKMFGIYYGTDNVIFSKGAVGLQSELAEGEREGETKVIRDFNYCGENKGGGHHHGHGRKMEEEKKMVIGDNVWAPTQ